jgi:hypothetical protein
MFASDGIDDERKPCAEEIYELATNASNLRQEADRRGAADVLRDMAMSTDRLGAALRRLRGQWEAVEKPTHQRTRSIKEWLLVYTEPTYDVRDEKGNLHTITRAEAAEKAYQEERARHDGWHQRELQRLMTHLSDLPAVRDAITIQAAKWGMKDAADKAGPSSATGWTRTATGAQGRSGRRCRAPTGRGPRSARPATAAASRRSPTRRTVAAWPTTWTSACTATSRR